MKFLLDIPIVMSAAYMIWGEAEEVSPESCVASFPFMALPCWSLAVAKALGVAMILGAFLNKAPVVVNLIDTETTEGLARGSIYGDILMYANGFCYGFLEGLPVTAYGENGALLLQSFVIMMLYWKFNKTVTVTERLVALLALLLYSYGVNNWLRPSQHYLLMATIWPANMASRGSQIYAVYQAKHTGANSIITTFMNLLGNVVRVFTTLQEVGFDLPMLTGFLVGVVLNGTCFAQHFIYWENTERFMQKLEQERAPKPPKKKKKAPRLVVKKPGEKMD